MDQLTDKLINVNNNLSSVAEFYMPIQIQVPTIDILTEENCEIYQNPANCWMAKIDDRYFLKLSIPEEKIFLWFYFN